MKLSTVLLRRVNSSACRSCSHLVDELLAVRVQSQFLSALLEYSAMMELRY